MKGQYWSEIQLFENHNIETTAFKVDQIKFLAMHITNQKYIYDTFMIGNWLNIFIEHDLYLIS